MIARTRLRKAALAAAGALLVAAPAQADDGRGTLPVPQVFDLPETTGSIAPPPPAAAVPERRSAAEAAPVERGRTLSADLERAATVRPLIARYAAEHGVPYDLADAVVRIESRYNPQARNGVHFGLTQINAQTARSLGYQGASAGLLEAETNLRYGLRYLADAYRLADGDTCGTILRYQAGHRAQSMTAAARAYCAKVKTILARTP